MAAGWLFALRERRARFPLIPAALLRSARVALALGGAFFGYLALFGPLVLMPQVLPGSAVRVGLLLTALRAGFGAAALGGERLLPAGLGNRPRGVAGALICALALAMLMVMLMAGLASDAGVAALLALAGLGLGIFVPANNAVIMRSAHAGSASVLGGLVNMARGIGTTFGIALVTIALPAAPAGRGGRPDPALALAVLSAASAAACGHRAGYPRVARSGRRASRNRARPCLRLTR